MSSAGLTIPEIVVLAVALALDATSVAASVGPRCCPRWGAVRMGLAFGFFQALMPLLGALAGAYLYVYVRAYDHWVAFGLLEIVGLKMLYEALRPRLDAAVRVPDTQGARFDPSWGWSLLGLGIATSIDAFGAGLGLRMVHANLWLASTLIGAITALLSFFGAHLGVRAEHWLGRRAELVGGLVLIVLGLRMLRV